MKLAVVGAGGVGGYFGGRLAQSGADVSFVARGAHLRAIRDHGLRVKSVFGDFELTPPVTNDPAEVGRCDYVLLGVKAYDTGGVLPQLAPLVGADTAILSVQNGVEAEEQIDDVLGEGHALGGAAFIFATIVEPGVIAHTGGPARIVFGEMDGRRTARAARLLTAFEKAAVNAELTETIRSVLWNKLAFICAQAGMTAAGRAPIGRVRAIPESWEMFRRLSEEVCAVASAEGIDLPADATARHREFAMGLGAESYSSLHHDLTRGKPLELEALHGVVIRRAARHGVPTPMTEAVYALLRLWAISPSAPPEGA